MLLFISRTCFVFILIIYSNKIAQRSTTSPNKNIIRTFFPTCLKRFYPVSTPQKQILDAPLDLLQSTDHHHQNPRVRSTRPNAAPCCPKAGTTHHSWALLPKPLSCDDNYDSSNFKLNYGDPLEETEPPQEHTFGTTASGTNDNNNWQHLLKLCIMHNTHN